MSRALEGVPPPVVPIRNAEHAEWCKLGAQLQQRDPEQFSTLLRLARRDLELADTRASREAGAAHVEHLKSVITKPTTSRRRH